jgi:hypothetical protein
MAADQPPVTLSLRYDEVLVLSDLLARWEGDGTMDGLPFHDQAEQRVLWELAATLEPLVREAFSSNYGEVVARARAAVRDNSA